MRENQWIAKNNIKERSIKYIDKRRFIIANNRLNKNVIINLFYKIINFEYNQYCDNFVRDKFVINIFLCTTKIILLQIYFNTKRVNEIEKFFAYFENLDI